MSSHPVWTLPNILTLARILLAPVIALLPFINGYLPKLVAFIVFLFAAISDIYDGRLARGRNQVSDLGKELDPLADKLLLVATLIPIYWITRYPMQVYELPWWGSFPLWAALLLIGREAIMTILRRIAAGRGVVIAAGRAGKIKTVVQDVFVGATIAWFAWIDMRQHFGWQSGWLGDLWAQVHGAVVAIALAGAVALTVYSLIVYLIQYRRVLFGPQDPSGR